jgi:hypothetical protein
VDDFDGAAGGADEAALVAEVEDPGGAVEQHGFEDGVVEQVGARPSTASSSGRTAEVEITPNTRSMVARRKP